MADIDRDLIRSVVEKVVADMKKPAPSSEDDVRPDPEVAKGFVPVGISARHLHVSQEHLEILFGKGHQLTPYRDLLQKGEFAAQETVTLIGPRMRAMEKIRILGPVRPVTQVELALTDAIYLGVRPPVRPSGNHESSCGILVVGPVGSVELESGVIRANRHIHISTVDANAMGLNDNDKVLVRVDKADRPLIYYDVQVRVKDQFVAEMHLDTDDANAAGVRNGDRVKIILENEECRICDITH